MNRYIATFHTHYSATRTAKNLTDAGISAQMAPVPRVLSTSCGTCVYYEAETPQAELMHTDYEGLYLIENGNQYHELQKND